MHIELIGAEAAGKTTFVKYLTSEYPDKFIGQNDAWELAKLRNKSLTNLDKYNPLFIEKIRGWSEYLPTNQIETQRAVGNIKWYERLVLQHAVISKNVNDFITVWDEGIIHNGNSQNIVDNKNYNLDLANYLKSLKYKLLIYFDTPFEENLHFRIKRRKSGYFTTKDKLISDSELHYDVEQQKIFQEDKYNILKNYIPTVVINQQNKNNQEAIVKEIFNKLEKGK